MQEHLHEPFSALFTALLDSHVEVLLQSAFKTFLKALLKVPVKVFCQGLFKEPIEGLLETLGSCNDLVFKGACKKTSLAKSLAKAALAKA